MLRNASNARLLLYHVNRNLVQNLEAMTFPPKPPSQIFAVSTSSSAFHQDAARYRIGQLLRVILQSLFLSYDKPKTE